ncbi:Mob1/phocein [Zopfochytrium polystomum]|nr:Mob1/phocein [Zopfochytrium polystomum]
MKLEIKDYKQICILPRHMDLNEWLAVNTFDFFNYTNLFYNALSEFCTSSVCPTMSAGPGHEFTWTDSQRRTMRLNAPQYVDYVMTWTQNVINDQTIFPTKSGAEFPRDFHATIRNIFRQLFRVYAHLYTAHSDKMTLLSLDGHLNTLFSHFISFGREFDLIDKKDMAPLQDLIVGLQTTSPMEIS